VNKTGGSRLFFGICFQFSLDIVKICLEKVGFQTKRKKKKKKRKRKGSVLAAGVHFSTKSFFCVFNDLSE
jgi:hypothetical protein